MFDIYIQDHFLKTPRGNLLQVPTLALAKAIEAEWEGDPTPNYQKKPLTSLVASALDRVATSRESYSSYVLQAVSQDVVLFWEETPLTLMKLQQERWTPVINEVNKNLGLNLHPHTSLSIDSLISEDEFKIRTYLEGLSDFKLVGFSHLITLSDSFVLSYLLMQDKLKTEDAWNLAHLHEHTQRCLWGEDQEALMLERAQKEEFFQTVNFLKLIG